MFKLLKFTGVHVLVGVGNRLIEDAFFSFIDNLVNSCKMLALQIFTKLISFAVAIDLKSAIVNDEFGGTLHNNANGVFVNFISD